MNFDQIMILIIVIVISIIAKKISFKFDVNRFLENRRKIKIDQLKNICPHGRIDKKGDNFVFKSYFSSPRGTTKWICSRCGCVANSEEDVNRIAESYSKNYNLFLKKEKEFIKKAQKLKII